MSGQQQVISENTEGKPLTGSWRAKIHKNKGFIMLVEEILQQIPSQGKEKDAEVRARVLENCEAIWKLGAAEKCGQGNGNNKVMHDRTVFHKKIENEAVITADSEPTRIIQEHHERLLDSNLGKTESINSNPEAQKAYDSKPTTELRKNKSKKTSKKACDC